MKHRRALVMAAVVLLLGWAGVELVTVYERARVAGAVSAAEYAARHADYAGEQTTRLTVGGRTVTYRVRVDHQAPDRTRLTYLDGDLAGTVVVTDGHRQWRYDPRVGKTYEAAATELPTAWPRGRVLELPGGLVAGRPTERVLWWGRGVRRSLWFDRETQLILRTRTERGGQVSDTAFTRLTVGPPAQPVDFTPPGPRAEVMSTAVSLGECERQLGLPVRLPTYLPAGYQLVGCYAYHCPCGCGMLAAQLLYSDGLGSLSVFYQDQRHVGCVLSDHCCQVGKERQQCVAGNGHGLAIVGRVDRQPVVVAVGDASQAELARVADSVPAG